MKALALLALVLAAAPAAGRVIVVGDSNATGLGVPPAAAWPRRLERMLDTPVQVFGSPGASLATPNVGLGTAARCVARMRGIFHPDVPVAILALGTNDRLSTDAALREAVRNLLDSLTAPTRWVCLLPPPSRFDIQFVRDVVADECAAAGAEILDGAAILSRRSDLAPDGVHLSRSGHYRLARAIATALRRPGDLR